MRGHTDRRKTAVKLYFKAPVSMKAAFKVTIPTRQIQTLLDGSRLDLQSQSVSVTMLPTKYCRIFFNGIYVIVQFAFWVPNSYTECTLWVLQVFTNGSTFCSVMIQMQVPAADAISKPAKAGRKSPRKVNVNTDNLRFKMLQETFIKTRMHVAE